MIVFEYHSIYTIASVVQQQNKCLQAVTVAVQDPPSEETGGGKNT